LNPRSERINAENINHLLTEPILKFLVDDFSETELVTWPFKKRKLTAVSSGNPKLD